MILLQERYENYLYAASATAKGCGLSSPKAAPLYWAIMWLSYK